MSSYKGSNDISAIEDLINRTFYIGKSKELSVIREVHHKMLTKFSDTPPYHLMDYEEACLHEEMFFANISDYEYSIKDLRITILDSDSSIALATFILEHKGMIVDDYSFTGQVIKCKVRCSIVCKKFGERWYIVHEHLSNTSI